MSTFFRTQDIEVHDPDDSGGADATRGAWGAVECEVGAPEQRDGSDTYTMTVTCPWAPEDDPLVVMLDLYFSVPESVSHDDSDKSITFVWALSRGELPKSLKEATGTSRTC